MFTPSLKHEIPNLVFNLVSLENKFGAIVNWVLKCQKVRIGLHDVFAQLGHARGVREPLLHVAVMRIVVGLNYRTEVPGPGGAAGGCQNTIHIEEKKRTIRVGIDVSTDSFVDEVVCRVRGVEDMMYYTTKFCSEANPNPKPNSKSKLSKSQKKRHEMRLPRGYVDFRWFFRHLV